METITNWQLMDYMTEVVFSISNFMIVVKQPILSWIQTYICILKISWHFSKSNGLQ